MNFSRNSAKFGDFGHTRNFLTNEIQNPDATAWASGVAARLAGHHCCGAPSCWLLPSKPPSHGARHGVRLYVASGDDSRAIT